MYGDFLDARWKWRVKMSFQTLPDLAVSLYLRIVHGFYVLHSVTKDEALGFK